MTREHEPWFAARRIERGFYFTMRLLFLAMAGFCAFLVFVVPHMWARVAFVGIAAICLLIRSEARP